MACLAILGAAIAEPGSNRVNRGGSWNNTASNLRAANRNNDDPGKRNSNLGFRLASPRLSQMFEVQGSQARASSRSFSLSLHRSRPVKDPQGASPESLVQKGGAPSLNLSQQNASF